MCTGVEGLTVAIWGVGARSSNVRISGLIPNLTYNITMVALSDHLPSPAVVVMVYTLGETHSYIERNYWPDLSYCVCHNSKFVYCYIECTVLWHVVCLQGGYFHTVLKCNNADLLYKRIFDNRFSLTKLWVHIHVMVRMFNWNALYYVCSFLNLCDYHAWPIGSVYRRVGRLSM